MRVPSLISSDSELITIPLDKVNVCNQYFTSVFPVGDGRTHICNLKTDQNRTISNVEFNPRNAFKTLKSSKHKYCYNPYGLPVQCCITQHE